jgi:hypothetical protein
MLRPGRLFSLSKSYTHQCIAQYFILLATLLNVYEFIYKIIPIESKTIVHYKSWNIIFIIIAFEQFHFHEPNN